MRKALTMLAAGDLILGGPEPDSAFALATPVLGTADVVVGQGEAPFTSGSVEKYYLEVPTEIFATPSCEPVEKHKELLGPYVEPDPEYPKHPYHLEALQTIIAKCVIEGGSISRV